MDEIDIDVIHAGRPVPLEIVEEARPITQQSVNLEVAKREEEAVSCACRPVLHHISGRAVIRDGRRRDPHLFQGDQSRAMLPPIRVTCRLPGKFWIIRVWLEISGLHDLAWNNWNRLDDG